MTFPLTFSDYLLIYAIATPIIMGIFLLVTWSKIKSNPQFMIVSNFMKNIKWYVVAFLIVPLGVVASWILLPYIVIKKIKRLIFGKSKKEKKKEEMQKQINDLMSGMGMGENISSLLKQGFPNDDFNVLSEQEMQKIYNNTINRIEIAEDDDIDSFDNSNDDFNSGKSPFGFDDKPNGK